MEKSIMGNDFGGVGLTLEKFPPLETPLFFSEMGGWWVLLKAHSQKKGRGKPGYLKPPKTPEKKKKKKKKEKQKHLVGV